MVICYYSGKMKKSRIIWKLFIKMTFEANLGTERPMSLKAKMIYLKAKKGERLSGVAIEIIRKKTSEKKEAGWRTQSERRGAREAEKDNDPEILLSESEILSLQYDKYTEAMKTLSHQTAWAIDNAEAYLHDCFKYAYMKSKHGDEKPWSKKSDGISEELEEVQGPDTILNPEQFLEGEEAKEKMAEWREKFRQAASFSQRQRDTLMMRITGITLKEIAAKLKVHPDTVKRDLQKLQVDPIYKELFKEYEEISNDIGELAPYRRPQRRENKPRICPTCKMAFGRGDVSNVCPFCHAELPRIPLE